MQKLYLNKKKLFIKYKIITKIIFFFLIVTGFLAKEAIKIEREKEHAKIGHLESSERFCIIILFRSQKNNNNKNGKNKRKTKATSR